MKNLLTLLLSIFIFDATAHKTDQNNEMTRAEKVIFDTDFAIDDWSALLLLGLHKNIDLIAVTANGAGETHCKPAMKNIASLLDLTTTGEVAIACGDDYPMDGFFSFPSPWRNDADTLSGVAVKASQRPISQLHSVELIHQILTREAAPITLLTTGSLTNIAQLLARYPQDKQKIKRLVIMGGAFDTPGNIIVPSFTDGHPNTRAEWNIYVDPIAAARVFESGLPIEVVGLDITRHVKVTTDFTKQFKASANTPAAKFWDQVLDNNKEFIDSGEYYFWDVLAALVVIDPHFCGSTLEPVWVQYETAASKSVWTDQGIPSKTKNNKTRIHLQPGTAGITHVGGSNPKVKICRTTDANMAFSLFIKTLNLN